jgi:hypothetical protein
MSWFADRLKAAVEKENAEGMADYASQIRERLERVERYDRAIVALVFIIRFATLILGSWALSNVGIILLDAHLSTFPAFGIAIAFYAFGRLGARRP